MQTLTIQDAIWINLLVTKKVNSFDYEPLEQAVFAQFAYGGQDDFQRQAQGVLASFLKTQPFTEGNEATGFLVAASFLALNGLTLTMDPSEVADALHGRNTLGDRVAPQPGYLPSLCLDVHEIVQGEYARFREALSLPPK